MNMYCYYSEKDTFKGSIFLHQILQNQMVCLCPEEDVIMAWLTENECGKQSGEVSFERDGLDLHHSNQTTVSRESDLSSWALRAGHLHGDGQTNSQAGTLRPRQKLRPPYTVVLGTCSVPHLCKVRLPQMFPGMLPNDLGPQDPGLPYGHSKQCLLGLTAKREQSL